MCRSHRFLIDTDRCAEVFGGILPSVPGRVSLVAAGLLACSLLLDPSPGAAQSYTRTQAGLTGVEASSSSFGDVNEDGHLDLFLMGRDTHGNKTATLYLGDGEGGFTVAEAGITGAIAGDSAFGDVDGDGHLDLLVTGGSARGFPSATLYLGDGDGSFVRADAGLVGVQSSSVSVGDVNGDGTPDQLVGAYRTSSNRKAAVGTAYVFSGADGSVLHVLGPETPRTSDRFGRSVAGIGDVNGDGRPDVAVGASGEDVEDKIASGRVYVFDGTTGEQLWAIASPLAEGASGRGSAFGRSVAAVGDVDDDGVPDLIVGASQEVASENEEEGAVNGAGQAYLLPGGAYQLSWPQK